MISDKEITPMTMMEKVCIGLKKGNKAMTDKMPENIYAWRDENYGSKVWCEQRVPNYVHRDIHKKAVKERDALKAENERLRDAVEDVLDDAGYEKEDGTYYTMEEKPHGGGICAATADQCIKALQGGE